MLTGETNAFAHKLAFKFFSSTLAFKFLLRQPVFTTSDAVFFRSTGIHTLNEDGELWLAYEGLKETNR